MGKLTYSENNMARQEDNITACLIINTILMAVSLIVTCARGQT
jgi:hypothetical protein